MNRRSRFLCDSTNRGLCNQAFFQKIYIDKNDELARPFSVLLDATVPTELGRLSLPYGGKPSKENKAITRDYHVEGDSLVQTVEVARQCSNLAPDLQMLVLAHPAIRLRPLPATGRGVGSGKKKACPVPCLTDGKLQEAEQRYKTKETLKVIARDLGVSRWRLAEHLRDRGVKIRGSSPTTEQVEEMRRRYAQGESLAAAGEKIGVDAGTVRKYLIAAGVRLRDCHGRER